MNTIKLAQISGTEDELVQKPGGQQEKSKGVQYQLGLTEQFAVDNPKNNRLNAKSISSPPLPLFATSSG